MKDLPEIPVCDFKTRRDLIDGIKVGTRVLIPDIHRRVYREDRSGPIRRYEYAAAEVMGETTRSWVVGYDRRKVPKKTLAGLFSNQCADRRSWINENGYRVMEVLRSKLLAWDDDRDVAYTRLRDLALEFDIPLEREREGGS